MVDCAFCATYLSIIPIRNALQGHGLAFTYSLLLGLLDSRSNGRRTTGTVLAYLFYWHSFQICKPSTKVLLPESYLVA